MNDVSKTIGWADFTFNPITGCKRGCPYCYARRMHERFNKTPFSDIVFHRERLDDLKKLKKPAKIFVGSMSDIEYWSMNERAVVAYHAALYPQHTFMFLSKSPFSYTGIDWPANCMQGLTMELSQTQDCQQKRFLEIIRYPRPFLSFEPLLGELKIEISEMEQVIVGAMSGPGAIAPKPEWIQSIKENAPAEKIYWKKNIKPYL